MACGNLSWPHTRRVNQGNEWVSDPVNKAIDQQSWGFNTLVSVLFLYRKWALKGLEVI